MLWYKPTEAAHTQESWHQQSQCKVLSLEHAESNMHNKSTKQPTDTQLLTKVGKLILISRK